MLADKAIWNEFLNYKIDGNHISKQRLKQLKEFIEEEGYLSAVNKIRNGIPFCPPTKKLINKINKSKKRVVYIFPADENMTLKLLTYILIRKYDGLFTPNLYSFRANRGVKQAISFFSKKQRPKYVYKADISNYFNSVNTDILLKILEPILSEEEEIFKFIKNLLSDKRVFDNSRLIFEEKGIMAGCPIASFLANVYLAEMDTHFYKSGSLYGRYSDDIIVFSKTDQQRKEDIALIKEHLSKKGLIINTDKEAIYEPGEKWTFLGITCENGKVDISETSAKKLKHKMRRKARSIIRWKHKKKVSDSTAVKVFIKAFNRKLFENPSENELTWTRWYFPIINTDETLKQIDSYMQECIRYIATESRNKKRFRFTYSQMKELGYRNIVHSYYSMTSNQ